LKTVDYVEADTPAEELGELPPPATAETAPATTTATSFVVSLHALAGIRHERIMLLPVTIHGERPVALLDKGSTHNFLPTATMRRLAFEPTGGDHLRVTVANSDGDMDWRSTCPSLSAMSTSPSRAPVLTWAVSTSSSVSTFCGPSVSSFPLRF
jgi:hypothetical protein